MSAAFDFVDDMRALQVLRLVEPVKVSLPLTRGDCVDGPRPCPHSTCRYHLASDVIAGHSPSETCCLDVADRAADRAEENARLREEAAEREEAILLGESVAPAEVRAAHRGHPMGANADWGGASLQEIGDILGVSREYVRQIEQGALAKIRGPQNYRDLLKKRHDTP